MWAFAEAAWVFKGNWVPSEQVIQEKKRNQATFSNLGSEVTLSHFHFFSCALGVSH